MKTESIVNSKDMKSLGLGLLGPALLARPTGVPRAFTAQARYPLPPRGVFTLRKLATGTTDICPNFAGNYCRLLGLFLKQPLLILRGSNSSGSTDQPAYCCNSSTNSLECKSLSSGTDFTRTELEAGAGIRLSAGSLHLLLRAANAKALHCSGATKVLRPILSKKEHCSVGEKSSKSPRRPTPKASQDQNRQGSDTATWDVAACWILPTWKRRRLLPDTSKADGLCEVAIIWSSGISGLMICWLPLLLGLPTDAGAGRGGSPEVSCGSMPRISAAHCVDVGCSSKQSACLARLQARKSL